MIDELEAIRARHEADERASEEGDGVSPLRLIAATIDRGDLIGLLDAARAELAELREAAENVFSAWDWWREDEYDRDAGVVDDAIRDLTNQARPRRSAEALKGT